MSEEFVNSKKTIKQICKFIQTFIFLLKCFRDSPVVLKMKFDDDEKLNLNMGRLLAHEMGHALGANHDDGKYKYRPRQNIN